MWLPLLQRTRWCVFFLVVAGTCRDQPTGIRESSDKADRSRSTTHSVPPAEKPGKDGPAVSGANHLESDRHSSCRRMSGVENSSWGHGRTSIKANGQ